MNLYFTTFDEVEALGVKLNKENADFGDKNSDQPFLDCTHARIDRLVREVEDFGGVLALSYVSIRWSI